MPDAPIRILYVDDNAHDRALVRDALELEHGGFAVTEARTRRDFEAHLQNLDFDVVLSDFNILGYNGLQVLDAVRERSADIPVIIVTGTGSEEVGVEAMKRGVADYVIKTPRHIQHLPQTILRVIETERLRAERARMDGQLRESEALFQTLANASPAGIFRRDANGDCVYVNQRWSEISGMARQAALGKGWIEGLHPDDRERVLALWARSVRAHAPFEAEYRFQRPDGSSVWVLGQALPERAENGEVIGFVGTITDLTERNRDRHALEMQGRIIDQIHDAVAEVDMDGIVRLWNKGSERMIGYTAEEMIGQSIERIYPPDSHERRRQLVIEPVLRKGQHDVEVEHVCKDGRHIWVHLSLSLLHDESGTPIGTLGYSIDITERLRIEHNLRLRQRALDASANGVVICNAALPGQPIIYVNPAFESLTGYSRDEVIGNSCSLLQGNDRQQPELAEIREALRTEVECRVLLRNYRKDGSLFWNELHITPVPDADGRVRHFVGILNNVTERVERQQNLEHRARHDELTGLYNRSAIREALDAMLGASPGLASVGVILMNIDRLHHVNDTLGHAAGDQVLIEVGQRLQRFAGENGCSAGRIAGDEFLLMTGPESISEPLETIAARAMHLLAQPYAMEGQSVYLTCSAGVSWSPDAGNDAAQLLGQADLAVNRAKQRGRNQVVLYSATRAAEVADRIGLGADMHEALQRTEMELHYQPLINAERGTIASVEALMRWNSPTRGAVSPGRFIPVAEDTGMIVVLGDWGLRSAVAQLQLWKTAGLPAVPVSVNASAVQFQRPEFIQEVADALTQAEVPPGLLKIEITESVVMDDAQTAVTMLKQLKELGIRISLDDFGTGYSSLGYLRQLPIDEIKIDKSFVNDVVHDNYAATLCRAIIAMSQQLQLTVVAEGVETEAQALFLKDAGCQLLQGYLFSKAVPAQSLGEMLGNRARWSMDGKLAS